VSWELEFHPRIREQFEDIDEHILRRIKESVDRLKERPRLGKPLKNTQKPTRSLRFGTPGGEYRAVYVLVERNEIVYVFHVDKREGDYDDLHRRYDL